MIKKKGEIEEDDEEGHFKFIFLTLRSVQNAFQSSSRKIPSENFKLTSKRKVCVYMFFVFVSYFRTFTHANTVEKVYQLFDLKIEILSQTLSVEFFLSKPLILNFNYSSEFLFNTERNEFC